MAGASNDEAGLVKALAAGDATAFETLYRRHNAAMVRFAAAIVQSRAAAEEVAQETWIAALRGAGNFEGRSSLAGWLFAILTNKARTRARQDGRMIAFDEGSEEGELAAAFDGRGRWKDLPDLWETITPERIVAGRSVLDHVQRAIDALPPAQRAVLLLRGQDGLDGPQVAAILGLTEANMRVLLHRARLAVRAALDRAHG